MALSIGATGVTFNETALDLTRGIAGQKSHARERAFGIIDRTTLFENSHSIFDISWKLGAGVSVGRYAKLIIFSGRESCRIEISAGEVPLEYYRRLRRSIAFSAWQLATHISFEIPAADNVA